ncbi:hexosaminidase [Bacteroides clarus YIT 12056]|uniref:beta-N-acetylhexosaminidase n=1 Tax=Bacteroides clarus YIT 12056 TaxID=762984 RepID=A0ABP2KN72_9BACE|nr:family 20 glycosylhydrolase [Bacteroides clarus]EGF49839.1 glycosyl hydrolase family 20, catalytic domain protein [Bacteroides clarus YIT 12056]SHG20542.1 hexosaminidase [Bacteroides clarus YIT 12056]
MKILKLPFAGLLFCTVPFWAGCGTSDKSEAPVSLTWEMGASDIAPGYYENSFVLKNISDAPLPKDWTIYYSQLPRNVKQAGNPAVKVESVNGNFFKMYPTESFTSLAPGDSMRITFLCSYKLDRNSHVPEGTYWVAATDGKEGKPLPVTLNALGLPSPESLSGYPDAVKIYESNLRLAHAPALKQSDILPSVKKVTPAEGGVVLDGKVALAYPGEYAGEARLLKEKLSALYGLEIVDQAPVTIALETLADKAKAVNDEYYDMVIGSDRIKISAATPHGVFNGTQTLLAMLKDKKAPYRLDAMSVEDYPDLLYRGQMIDIARNFTTADNLKKLVDIFASYKMNVLHFHFADDEAWRLEIPGLEELTAVGSCRGHTTDESRCLYPCYDGGYDPDASTVGNGHYSREDFIGLLRYAAERHIRVIPEIESPGHARAAIVSMKARYNRYKDTDMEKAAEYLLSEPEDTSRYASVQYYTDNVINVAMPSAYRFMEKVIQELAAMYEEAGVPLTTVHLGGDEVARGVWLGSPKCRALMKEEGMTKPHDLAEYFITQMAGIMQRNGLKFSGWQEVALGHTEEAHRQLRTQAAGVYCWNTVPGYDEVVYQIANNGYPVILCNVGNFYMDMAYNGHPDERGLDWGGYVDEAISFSMLPFSIYRSLRTDGAGDSVDLDKAEKGKTVLTAEGRKNILGVQGQLFAETIRSFSGVEYLLFPKIMGLAERGWNAYPAWEKLRGAQEQQAFDKALALYYEKISDMEMPYWAKNGINFRLPHPGLLVKDGTLYANTAIRGAEIRYTMDGSEPTVNSALWEMPMKCDASVVKAGTFYQGKASLPITLKVE